MDRLEFATPFVYSSRGTSDASSKSRALRDHIKSPDTRLFEHISAHVRALADSGTFAEFFADDVTLIPVPEHTPLAPGHLVAVHAGSVPTQDLGDLAVGEFPQVPGGAVVAFVAKERVALLQQELQGI